MRGDFWIKAHFFALLRFKPDRSRDTQKPTILGRNTRSGSTQPGGTTSARSVMLSNQSCLSWRPWRSLSKFSACHTLVPVKVNLLRSQRKSFWKTTENFLTTCHRLIDVAVEQRSVNRRQCTLQRWKVDDKNKLQPTGVINAVANAYMARKAISPSSFWMRPQ